jgi:hypothetical protein
MIWLDPLSGHSDPRLYVPLDSGESALAAIAMGLKAGCSPVLLAGPSGVGKTLLLRMLAGRELESYSRTRFSPRLPVDPDDFAACLLHLLFGKPCPGDPEEAQAILVNELRAASDRRTLLLVDNIHRTDEASIRKLAELTRASGPALAIVVAGTSGEDLRALTATLAPGLIVSLPESLPESEIEVLYEALVAHAGFSPLLRQRLKRFPRAEITRVAAGLPRLLKNEVARRDQDRLAAAGEATATERRERETVPASPRPYLRLVPPAPAVVGSRSTRAPRARVVAASSKRAAVLLGVVATMLLAGALFSLRENAFALALGASAAQPVNAQVSARPWSRARIDGVDVDLPPLGELVTPGIYKVEAEFPDGK